jgi:hypothetical protein
MTEPLDVGTAKLISQSELLALGIEVRNGDAPAERGNDLLQRFIEVPNRLAVAYSSEDEFLCDYITRHWSALDGMSGDWCDIYTSMLQLSGGEDVYSAMSDLRMLPGGKALTLEALPIALLWSDKAFACISLREFSSSKSNLSAFFRLLFQYLRDINRSLTYNDRSGLQSALASALPRSQSQVSYNFLVGTLEMTNNEYKADRGGVVVGPGASTGNITITYGGELDSIDLSVLAAQLRELRAKLRVEADDDDATHDVAISQIAIAANAATAGKRDEVFTALKGAGRWALSIAEKLGESAVTQVIKQAMGG